MPFDACGLPPPGCGWIPDSSHVVLGVRGACQRIEAVDPPGLIANGTGGMLPRQMPAMMSWC